MKAVILAAGKGERLEAITQKIPKPLIKVKGEPVIERNIKVLKSLGVQEIFINTHYKSEMIKAYLGNGDKYGIKIVYSYEQELLGTAGALKNFQKYIKKDFFVIYGDNYFDFQLNDFIKFHFEKKSKCTIGLYYRKDVSESGIVRLDDFNRVNSFIEKPEKGMEVSNLVNTGIYLCSLKIFDYIHETFSDFGKDVFPLMVKEHFPLYGYLLKGYLLPIDNIELLKKAETIP